MKLFFSEALGAALLPHRGAAAPWHPDTWQAGTGAQT